MTSSSTDIASFATHMKAAGKPRSTIYLRTWQLRRLAEALSPLSLRTATTAHLAAYLTNHNWSPATKASLRHTLRQFYGFLRSAGTIRSNPALGLPVIRVPQREPRPAPESVVNVARDERTQLMVDLGARQGLRRAEIAAIHSRDLVRDLSGWSLIVHGKGSRERTIPLHDDIAARIRAAGPGWLFPSPRPGEHLTANRVGCILSAELGDGWTAHSLRRRFATKIYSESHDLRSVQQLLGHASMETTQRYIGTSTETLRDAIRHAA